MKRDKRERERERDRETERQRQRDRDRERDRQTDREREREGGKKERERGRVHLDKRVADCCSHQILQETHFFVSGEIFRLLSPLPPPNPTLTHHPLLLLLCFDVTLFDRQKKRTFSYCILQPAASCGPPPTIEDSRMRNPL